MAANINNTTPPYVPWKTFTGFIGHWKNTTPPHTLDSGVMPKSLSGSARGTVVSALKFFGLISKDGVVAEDFAVLVRVHGTTNWAASIKEKLLPAYESVIGDLPIDNATGVQLDTRFRAAKVDGQMLRKCVRFYLNLLKASGVTYSPYFAIRREASSNTTRKKKATTKTPKSESKKTRDSAGAEESDNGLLTGMDRLPLGSDRFVYLPIDLLPDEIDTMEKMIPYLRSIAGEGGAP